MQIIFSKTLKTFALLNLFFLFLSVKKRNKKTPGCIVDFFHFFFRSLIFARHCCAKIYAKRKKVEPKIKNARPYLLFYPSVSHEQTRCLFGWMLFLGQPGGMADRKEKSREREQSFVLDFFCYCSRTTWLKCALHICPNQAKKVDD